MREEFFQYLENNKSEFSQELVDAVKILKTK